MKINLPDTYQIQPEVSYALTHGKGVVALEYAVITHGLPHPTNLELAKSMEAIIRENGTTPATIALYKGKMAIGLNDAELTTLAVESNAIKVSLRNMGVGISRGLNGGTTVSATLLAATVAGIKVFATGGIGGVHLGNPLDISTDLNALAENPVIVVCAGAKAILNLPATLEALETRGVPVIGYQTDEFPAFYSRTSGLPIDYRIETAREACEIARAHWKAGNHSAVLVCNPIPIIDELSGKEIDQAIREALDLAERNKIRGGAVTLFLLEQVNLATHGKSMQANVALLRNNALLAAEIAACFNTGKLVTF